MRSFRTGLKLSWKFFHEAVKICFHATTIQRRSRIYKDDTYQALKTPAKHGDEILKYPRISRLRPFSCAHSP
jgi:hypothetical protein